MRRLPRLSRKAIRPRRQGGELARSVAPELPAVTDRSCQRGDCCQRRKLLLHLPPRTRHRVRHRLRLPTRRKLLQRGSCDREAGSCRGCDSAKACLACLACARKSRSGRAHAGGRDQRRVGPSTGGRIDSARARRNGLAKPIAAAPADASQTPAAPAEKPVVSKPEAVSVVAPSKVEPVATPRIEVKPTQIATAENAGRQQAPKRSPPLL